MYSICLSILFHRYIFIYIHIYSISCFFFSFLLSFLFFVFFPLNFFIQRFSLSLCSHVLFTIFMVLFFLCFCFVVAELSTIIFLYFVLFVICFYLFSFDAAFFATFSFVSTLFCNCKIIIKLYWFSAIACYGNDRIS